MTKVILDTTTILDFARFLNLFASSNFQHVKIDIQKNIEIMESIENIIEALILYDEVLIDGKSFFFNYKDENLVLSNFTNACSFIELTDEQEESIYKKISTKLKEGNFIDYIKRDNFFDYTFKDYPQLRDAYEADHDNFWYESFYKVYHNDFLLGLKNGNFMEIYNQSNPTIKQFFYHLIRCFYYHELQITNSSQLVINPKRFELAQTFFGHKKIYTNNIIEIFDNEVRKKLYSKEKRWLGEGNDSLLMPMVTSYVFNMCKSWEDLYKVIIEVKNSKEAVLFRNGLSELIKAVKDEDLVTINDTLSSLDDAAIKWNKNLKCKPLIKHRTISLSIPMIGGIGTDISIPYSWGNNISSKLLTFIHKMIINS
jgi:hypothetical protein